MSSARRVLGSIAFGGLTPLLDTLFLLLFALLAMSDARTANTTELVRIKLPAVEPGDAAPEPERRRLVLEIDADSLVRIQSEGGAISAERMIASREELDRELAAFLGDALPEEVAIEIRADRDARHGVAIELLQHLRLRGFVRVQLVALGLGDRSGPFGGER